MVMFLCTPLATRTQMPERIPADVLADVKYTTSRTNLKERLHHP